MTEMGQGEPFPKAKLSDREGSRAAYGLSEIVIFHRETSASRVGDVPVKLLFCGSALLQFLRLNNCGEVAIRESNHHYPHRGSQKQITFSQGSRRIQLRRIQRCQPIQQFLPNHPAIATVSLYVTGVSSCERIKDFDEGVG